MKLSDFLGDSKMKVVINSCYGGFSISQKCAELMAKLGNKQAKAELKEWKQHNDWVQYFLKNGKWPKSCPKSNQSFLEIDAKYHKKATFHGFGYVDGFDDEYKRNSSELIKAVKTLGKKANGRCANLQIVEIPDDVEWQVEEYDGLEHIAEKHRTWS